MNTKSLKRAVIVLAALLSVTVISDQVFARGGGRGPMGGPTDMKPEGAGPMAPVTDILSGEAVTVSGTVSAVKETGFGLDISTGAETVTVYGIGPAPYWESLGVSFPAVGDSITVDAYKVTLGDGSQKLFASKITIGDNQVQLIDTETGKPLWRKGPRPEPVDILSGEPVTVTGTVTAVGEHGFGLEIKTDTETVTVNGIGPAPYWESLGVSFPAVGDAVAVDAYNVTLGDGSQKVFASKITIGDNQVQLVDTETGKPLWGKGPKNRPVSTP